MIYDPLDFKILWIGPSKSNQSRKHYYLLNLVIWRWTSFIGYNSITFSCQVPTSYQECCNLIDHTSCNLLRSSKRKDESFWSNIISRKRLVLSIKGRVSCQLSNLDFLHNISGQKIQQAAEFASELRCSLKPKFAFNLCFSCLNLSESICKWKNLFPKQGKRNP